MLNLYFNRLWKRQTLNSHRNWFRNVILPLTSCTSTSSAYSQTCFDLLWFALSHNSASGNVLNFRVESESSHGVELGPWPPHRCCYGDIATDRRGFCFPWRFLQILILYLQDKTGQCIPKKPTHFQICWPPSNSLVKFLGSWNFLDSLDNLGFEILDIVKTRRY